MKWLLARLREPSTWRGLVWLLTVLGVKLAPEAWEYIMTAGMALAGLLGVLTREEPTVVSIELPPIALQGRSESADVELGIGALQPADELRLPTNRRPRPAGTADPNIQPNPAGFGDRG